VSVDEGSEFIIIFDRLLSQLRLLAPIKRLDVRIHADDLGNAFQNATKPPSSISVISLL
jgi:hypothetical protein